MGSGSGMRFLGLIAVSALVLAIGAAPAAAVPIIKFDQGLDQDTQDGFLSWSGGVAPLSGEDIGFSIITGLGDLAGIGLSCNPLISGFGQPCMLLDFTTGPFAGASGGILSWSGGATSSFVVTLTHDNALGLGLSAGTALLTGTAMFGADLLPPFGGFRNLSITGLDFKHEALLAEFFPLGAPEEFVYSNTEITIAAGISVSPVTGFSDDIPVSDADINNIPLPEPGTTLLMLLGIGGLALRKRFA